MAATRGKRVRGKKKPKSIKAKVTHKMSSKRRLSRMGKEMKKGQKGIVANYMTRSQVLRRLQISLRDFRRLCILKGIYPRDPKKKVSGKDKAYYHIKDVGYLAHEPLLNKFREFKAFMKKVRKAISRGDKELAKKREASRPQYTLDHLVKERYPRFSDALGDLDDALSLIHLFATLPADGPINPERTEQCRRLSLEWQYYVARSHSLSKVFVSIKGIYFQAEIQGQPITWIIPHNFTQVAPPDVDFRIMLTFLEFYETLLKFTMFKLYHSLELLYPPVLDGRLDDCGIYMAAVRGLPIGHATAQDEKKKEDEKEEEISMKSVSTPKRIKGLEEKLSKLVAAEEGLADGEDVEEEDLPEGALSGPLGEALEEVMEGPDAELYRRDMEEQAKRSLFRGLKFFLSREIPMSWVNLVISSLGGVVGWEGEGSPFPETDKGITHHVVDRPVVACQREGREYIQPQWIFDSINSRILLPVDLYGPGKALPPHLSPFVDDEKEGYIPAYREQLDQLRNKAAASVYKNNPDQGEKEDASDGNLSKGGEEEDSEDEEDEEERSEEGNELAKIMMSKKEKNQYHHAKRVADQRKEKAETLMAKRRKLEKKNGRA